MTGRNRFRADLTGGDRRSIGRANEVAARASGDSKAYKELVALLEDDEPVVAMRAADALEKASATNGEELAPFADELLRALDECSQADILWHLIQMLPRLPLTRSQAKASVAKLHKHMSGKSRIVAASAMSSIQAFALRDSSLAPHWEKTLREAAHSETASLAARARRLLAEWNR